MLPLGAVGRGVELLEQRRRRVDWCGGRGWLGVRVFW